MLDAALVPFRAGGDGPAATALFAVADRSHPGVTAPALRAHLSERVAPEAVPAVVHLRDRLPLTDSGKVDRARLARRAADGRRWRASRRQARRSPADSHGATLCGRRSEIDELGADDDFFELGGDSLAAAEVCAGVESVYGLAMEPSALLRHGSARALSGAFARPSRARPRTPANVLRLNPGGAEPPLFVVPGAGSEATSLVHFAEAIGHRAAGVRDPASRRRRAQPAADGDGRITAHCLDAIRQTGVPPPYRVAGTSFGGLVAYDIATELHRQGIATDYVGLFDTSAPSTRRRNQLTEPLRRFRPPKLTVRGLLRSPRAELRRLRTPLGRLLTNYRLTLSLMLGLRWQPPIELRFRLLRAGCSIAAGRWTPSPDQLSRSPLPVRIAARAPHG